TFAMDLTQRFLAFTLLGANWVLWLLVGLSVVSVGIMLERLIFLWSARLPDDVLGELNRRLAAGETDAARELLRGRKGIAAQVALEGLTHLGSGADAAAEAMNSMRPRERLQLERNLAILGTLGNNAPFIGLFGTVLGIIKAFHDLSMNQGGGAGVVM